MVAAGSRSRLAQLPERVLACQASVPVERPEVTAPNLDPLALDRRSADRPFRDAPIAGDEMIVLPVANVRDPLEPGGEPAPDLLLADEAAPPRIGATWRFEDAFLRKRSHDRVQVVPVERGQHGPESLQPLLL